MRMPFTMLAAAVIAGSASMLCAPAGAAPMSGSLALKNSAASPVETVRYRHHWNRWRHSGAYLSFGFVPGARAAPVPRVNSNNTGRHPERRFRDPAKGENN